MNNIRTIIDSHCDRIKNIDPDTPVAKIVKNIDVIINQLYIELYATRDNRKLINKYELEKKGHCC